MAGQTLYRNCLYIHGLHSSVNLEKVAIMNDHFSNVTARHIIYSETPEAFTLLKEMCTAGDVDFIIGSSFGAYLGFYLSRALQLPSILFNPALVFRGQDTTYIQEEPLDPSPFALFVIGAQDDVIPPASTEMFLKANPVADNIQTVRCSWLGHRIDLRTFDAMIASGIRLASGRG